MQPYEFRVPFDVRSAANYLGTSERHVRNLIARREIPFTKVGRLIRFRPVDLDRWLDERTVHGLST